MTTPDSGYGQNDPYGEQAFGESLSGQGGYSQYDAAPPPGQQRYGAPNQMSYPPQPYTAAGVDQKSKLAAGLLGIFLGVFGVHNFYLGHTTRAVVQLLVSVLSGGFLAGFIAIWTLVEGILILTAQPGSHPWGVDANSVPLRE